MKLLPMILLAAAITPVTSGVAQSKLPLVLTFDGSRLSSLQSASFSCFSYSTNRWVGCRVSEFKDGRGWRHEMERPVAGRYRIHVNIDEVRDNPGAYPGDFEAIAHVEITPSTDTLAIPMERLIHVKSPFDNWRSIPGAFSPCDREPDFEAPFTSLKREAEVSFAWSPVASGAAYRYGIYRARCNPYGRLEPVLTGETDIGILDVDLPPNEEGEHYQFVVEAIKDGRRLGYLKIHDGGGHGWDYRFRVALEEPDADLVFVAALGGVMIFFLLGLAFLLVSRRWALAAGSALLIAGLASVEYQLYQHHEAEHRQIEVELLAAELRAQRLQEWLDQSFLAEWIAAAPKPGWWDRVSVPPYAINNVGDLLSFWQSDRSNNGDRTYVNRQFFKTGYAAIEQHPGDDELVSTAVDLMAFVGRDYEHRQSMLELAVEHFFDFDRDTTRCAGCNVGDRTNSLVELLGRTYLDDKRYDDVIDLAERLYSHRRSEISDYEWAGTARLLATSYWETGRKSEAIRVAAEALSDDIEHPNYERLQALLDEWKSPSPVEGRRFEPLGE